MLTGVTIEEARWLDQEASAHQQPEETPREQALEWCRHVVGRYGGADELASLPVIEAGPCMDGIYHHEFHAATVRYQVGKFAVCRTHAILRLRARRHAEKPVDSPILEPRQQQPADLLAWTIANAALDDKTMADLLTEWRIDTDTINELLDVAREEAIA